MASKIRKQIYIDSDQEFTLKRLTKDTGISEAEIIRQALDRYACVFQPPRRDLSAWEKERAFIQQLIDEGCFKGAKLEAGFRRETTAPTWKREDLYDR